MRKWLADLRKQAGMTMREASEKLGISESYYCLIESGARQKKMDILLLVRIADLFHQPILGLIEAECPSEGSSAALSTV